MLAGAVCGFLAIATAGAVAFHRRAEAAGCFPLQRSTAAAPVPTASPSTVRFLALGDVGSGGEGQRRVARTALRLCREPGCDFLLLLGDKFYENGVSGPDDPKFATVFERIYGPIGKPVFAVLGNHDVRGDGRAQVDYMRQSPTWRMPDFDYWFRAGPARFFAVNTNCRPLSLLGLDGELSPEEGGWTFLFGHHPFYGNGPHGDANWLLRRYWETNLADKVDFLPSGHNHDLEHLTLPGSRTDHITSGSGGKYAGGNAPARPGGSAAQSRFLYRGNGLVAFELTARRARVRFYDADGRVLYQFTRDKP